VTSNTGGVFENNFTASLPGGGAEIINGYQVGKGIPSNEIHTHTFGNEIGGVQIRTTGLNTMETLVLSINGQEVDLNQAIADGSVSFDPGGSGYFIDSNGHLAASVDIFTPMISSVITINIPMSSLSIENVSSNGFGNGTLYELSLDTTPVYIPAPGGGGQPFRWRGR